MILYWLLCPYSLYLLGHEGGRNDGYSDGMRDAS